MGQEFGKSALDGGAQAGLFRFREKSNSSIGFVLASDACMECPANSVPDEMRQTGMEGAEDGQGKEAHAWVVGQFGFPQVALAF